MDGWMDGIDKDSVLLNPGKEKEQKQDNFDSRGTERVRKRERKRERKRRNTREQ